MEKKDFQNEAIRMGYRLLEIDKTSQLKRDRVSDGRNVTVTLAENSIQIDMQVDAPGSSKYARFVFGDCWKAFMKLREVNNEVFQEDNSAMFDPENMRAARLVQEVRSINLEPNDRLVVTVREDAGIEELETLADMFSKWLGDKGQHRVLIAKNIDVKKVSNHGNKE